MECSFTVYVVLQYMKLCTYNYATSYVYIMHRLQREDFSASLNVDLYSAWTFLTMKEERYRASPLPNVLLTHPLLRSIK